MLPMTVGRSSSAWWGDEIPRGRGSFGVSFPTDSALYGPYSGMNFATKNDLAYIYLVRYLKSRTELNARILKGIFFTNSKLGGLLAN